MSPVVILIFCGLKEPPKLTDQEDSGSLNKVPSLAVQLFQTDWTKSGDEVTSVKYTYVKNDTNKDSYINYYHVQQVISTSVIIFIFPTVLILILILNGI